jgi:tetratricopeptide (TPR) repeat protein
MKAKSLIKIFSISTIIFFSLNLYSQRYDDEGFAIPGSITGEKYGSDSVKCITQLSLYRENFRQWKSSNYENEAIKYTVDSWRYVFNNCPLASQYTYTDGSKIIEYLYSNTNDKQLKEAYIDTLMILYDQRIQAFSNEATASEGFILGRKGIELISYSPNAVLESNKILSRSISKLGNESESAVILYYFLTTVRSVKEFNVDSLKIFENYDIASDIISYNIKKYKYEIEANPTEASKTTKALENYEATLNNIDNLFEPFATCDNLLRIYSKKFEQNPNDTSMLERLISSFDKKDCTPELYYQANEQLYKIKPSPSSAFAIGKMYLKLNNYSKATKFLQDVAESKDIDNETRADAYYHLAEAYKSMNNYSSSRINAIKSAELKPTDGKPWILIGDLYAMSASGCGDNKVTSKAAYWAAVDKYTKARSIDESVSSIANSRISTYKNAFPKGEDIFFYGFNVGDTYEFKDCWINETTTIRSSD